MDEPLQTLLINAQHHLANVRKPAEEKLRIYETQSGFANALLGVVGSEHVQASVRLLAIICLKNVVHRQWRKAINNQQNMITKEEKLYVKKQLFVCLSYPNKAITAQACAVIAKVARIDWPLGQWEDLFPTLLRYSSSGQGVTSLPGLAADSKQEHFKLANCNKAVMTLNKVLKEFLTMRMPSTKQRYQHIIFDLLPILISDFSRHFEFFVKFIRTSMASNSSPENVNEIASLLAEISKNSLKCVYHVFATEYESIIVAPGQNNGDSGTFMKNEVTNFMLSIVSWLPVIEEMIHMFPREHGVEVLLRKIYINLTRCVCVVQRVSPQAFENTLVGATANNGVHQNMLVCKYFQLYFPIVQRAALSIEKNIASRISSGLHLENAYINILRFFSSLIDKSSSACMSLLFNNTNIEEITTITITSFMSLSEEDIMEWDSNPEQYVLKQDSLTTYERLRPAAENLYLSLLDRFPDVVGALLVQKILKSHESSVFGNDNVGDGIVGNIRNAPSRMHACKIDGVYLAIGLNAYALNQHLNYGTWFMNRLVPVLTYSVNTTPEASLACSASPSRGGQGPGMMIVQRRVLWMIGCVCGELPDELYGPLYEALLSLLERGVGASGGDLVVRLAAVSAFKALVERCGFGIDAYTGQEAVLGRYLGVLYSVLNDANEFDTRSQILTLISDLIERLGDKRVVSCIDVVVGPLPRLWESSQKQNLLRSSILGILRQVVEAVGPLHNVAPRLHATIYPLIAYSVDTRHPESIYLSDDGLALWEAVLKATPLFCKDLLSLLPGILPLLEFDFSRTKIIMSIVASYILIGGIDFMKTSSSIVVQSFDLVLKHARRECAVHVVQTMDLIFQCYPKEAIVVMKSPVCLMAAIAANTMKTGNTANVKSGRNVRAVSRDRFLIGSLSLFARILLQTPSSYYEVLTASNDFSLQKVEAPMNGENLHKLMLCHWIMLYDYLGGGLMGPWRRKLWTLALTVLWSRADAAALEHGTEIVNIFISSITNNSSGSEFYLPSMDEDHSGLSLEAKRKMQVMTSDPLHSIDVRAAVTESMNACANNLGVEKFQMLVGQHIDNVIFQELRSLLASNGGGTS